MLVLPTELTHKQASVTLRMLLQALKAGEMGNVQQVEGCHDFLADQCCPFCGMACRGREVGSGENPVKISHAGCSCGRAEDRAVLQIVLAGRGLSRLSDCMQPGRG